MQSVNALVVFYSRHGTAEQLAVNAGVGAIQARANVRLRRLADLADPAAIEASPEWKRNLEWMKRDYVTPRPADPVWADLILLVAPSSGSAEVEQYVASLPSLGSMIGRIAAPLAVGNSESALKPIYAAAACAGLIVAPGQIDAADIVSSAKKYGKQVAEMARALKTA